jgi:hypothetical protein
VVVVVGYAPRRSSSEEQLQRRHASLLVANDKAEIWNNAYPCGWREQMQDGGRWSMATPF